MWTISDTQRKPSRATTQSIPFTVSKDEWHAKKGTGKSMKNALHVLRYAKRRLTSQAEAMSNSEKIKPTALAVIELCWSEGIS